MRNRIESRGEWEIGKIKREGYYVNASVVVYYSDKRGWMKIDLHEVPTFRLIQRSLWNPNFYPPFGIPLASRSRSIPSSLGSLGMTRCPISQSISPHTLLILLLSIPVHPHACPGKSSSKTNPSVPPRSQTE